VLRTSTSEFSYLSARFRALRSAAGDSKLMHGRNPAPRPESLTALQSAKQPYRSIKLPWTVSNTVRYHARICSASTWICHFQALYHGLLPKAICV